jgi:18S rRNA (guanine1575-N7)-methyltransferase
VLYVLWYSISAVQWLCNADKKEHVPQRRLITFFKSLYKCLQQGAPYVFVISHRHRSHPSLHSSLLISLLCVAMILLCCHNHRAVFQLYPEGTEQLEMITNAAMKSGFSGGVVIDYPNSTKARKYVHDIIFTSLCFCFFTHKCV